jgi:hypothetical protein
MSSRTYANGVLSQWWDDDTRTFKVYGDDGALVSTRPYTAEENARADAEASSAQQDTNRATIELALGDALATPQAVIDDTNASINSNPAARIKDIARTQRRAIRLLTRRFDGTA